MKVVFCYLILLVSLLGIHVVNGKGEIVIHLTTFRDLQSLDIRRQKCDNGVDDCDIQVQICTNTIKVARAYCDGHFNETKVYGNQSNINFTNEQYVLPFTNWTGHVGLNINIQDDNDSEAADMIDVHHKYYAISVTSTGPTYFNYSLTGEVSTLNFTIETRCSQHYYNNKCSNYCNDNGQHYKCNSRNGSKICRTGWDGVECDVLLPMKPGKQKKSGMWITSTAGGVATLCVVTIACVVLVALGALLFLRERIPRKVGNAGNSANVAGNEEKIEEVSS